ncbi:MAG: metallophosphoesterase family protein [bacterium]
MPNMGYMPHVFPSDKFIYSYYPGDIYGQKTPAHLTTSLPQKPGEIIGTIGIITDIHYSDKDSTDRRSQFSLSGPRFYSEAANDLADFVDKMNSMGVDAIIELGDFIDIHSGNSAEEGNTNTHDDGAHGEAILFEAESIYSKLVMPYYHVIGNWDMYDYDFATADEWFRHIINGTPETIVSLGGKLYTDAIGNPVSRYYAFKFGEVLGIALDSSGTNALRDNYLMHTTGINGTGFVPGKQLDWLEDVLADNRDGENMPVIVFIHPFLYPEFMGNNYYMCRNYLDVRDILEADDNVLAVFNGHHHPGADGWWEDTQDNPDSNVYHAATGVFGEKHKGIKYYNLRGSIIGWGSDSSGPIEEPSNVYYVLTVERGESISIKVETFSTN